MPENKSKRILIAEDEKAYSRALVLKLTNAGFYAECCANGEEAIEALKKGNFDLLLCDLVMPKMNGFQILEELSKLGLKIPVIGLSNLSQSDDEKKMRAAGAVDFILKSNTPIFEVVEKIKAFLNKK